LCCWLLFCCMSGIVLFLLFIYLFWFPFAHS
jgi:hypothetical protein